MLHTNNPIIKHKAGLLNLAEELGNVSRACKAMGEPAAPSIAIVSWLKMAVLMRLSIVPDVHRI